jgi:O-antigen ligase
MIRIAYAALWIFVFTLPWERVFALPGVNIITRATGGVAVALALLAVVISGRLRRWQGLHTAALAFVVTTMINLLVFHSAQRLPLKFYTFIQLFAVVWMMWELAPSWSRLVWLLTAFVLGASAAAIGQVLVYRHSAGDITRYTVGGDANDLAMGLALALPMAWYLAMAHRRPILKWICRGYIPVGLMGIGLTGSRGGMIVSVVALLFIPLSMTKLTPGRLAMAIATLGLAGSLAVAYIPDRIVERLASTTTEVQDLRVGGRFKLWVAGLKVFSVQPVWGYGTSSYKSAIEPYLGDAAQVAHNSFISVLVEEGMIGLFCFAAMLLSVFLALWRLPRLERRFTLVLFCALGLAMSPLTWEDSKVAWFVMAVLMGLAKAGEGYVRGGATQPAPSAVVVQRPLRGAPLDPVGGAVRSGGRG